MARPSGEFRLLIADPEAVARKFLRVVLERSGQAVIDEVEEADEALAALALRPYHLVFLELELPNLGGLAVLERGKRIRPDCEFILLSAWRSMDTAIQSLDLGAFSVLVKPFGDLDLIGRKVEEALALVSLRIENDMLLERLNQLLAEFEIAERSLALSRSRPNIRPGEVREQQDRVRLALDRLRGLSAKFDRVRVRVSGKAARVFDQFGRTVADVATLLDPAERPPAPSEIEITED